MVINSGLSKDKLVENLLQGKIKMHELDALAGIDRAVEVRRLFLEKKLGLKLEALGSSILTGKECDANIENMVGSVQLPLGIAGPLEIKGEYVQGCFYIPLATTEGALVASVNRGCSAISRSGGAEAVIIKSGQTRSILFRLNSVKDVKKFILWVNQNFGRLKTEGEKNERFLDIIAIEPFAVGLNVWLRIRADTKDAMGMNMVTIAAKKIADFISGNFKDAEFISESGNMCVDKKPSALNLIEGRGKTVIASASLKMDTISTILKTTPEKLVELNYRKNLLGSSASGSLGFNAHFANIIAALFIATGQDAAHIAEGSMGFTIVEKTRQGVNFSVTLPSLHVGTVGGGTGLVSQKECLSVLGICGGGNSPGVNSTKFAEIVACAVLAGEISLIAALSTKELSSSHLRLNR